MVKENRENERPKNSLQNNTESVGVSVCVCVVVVVGVFEGYCVTFFLKHKNLGFSSGLRWY